jgi:hypothetical protein
LAQWPAGKEVLVGRQEYGTRGSRGHASRGRNEARVAGGWADLLAWVLATGALAAGLAVWTTDVLSWTEMLGATAAAGLLAASVWTLSVHARRWEWRVMPAPSPSGILFGLGVPAILIGTALGGWLVVFGVDAVVLGVVALVAELRGQLRP